MSNVHPPTWQVRIFYDGDCPLCMREVRMLARRDDGRGRIEFTDIAAPDFDASEFGLDQQTVMGRIHGQLPDGRIIEGMEVFRRVYAAAGLGWLLAPSAWPGLRPLFDAAYRVFARNRLRWTGREDACATGSCAAEPRRIERA